MNRRKGFTLMELLIVIAIIALLMAILMPALNKAKKLAKDVTCRARLREWGLMWQMYTSDNNGYFHTGRYGTSGVNMKCWVYVLQDYHDKDDTVRTCPEAGTPGVDRSGNDTGARLPWSAWGMLGPWWAAGITTEYYYGSYGISDQLYNRDWRAADGGFSNWRHTNHSGTDRIPVMTSCAFITATLRSGVQSSTLVPPQYDGESPFTGSAANQMGRFCLNRHDGKTNGLFMDWGVRNVGLKELWTLKWSPLFDTENAWTKAGGATYDTWANWGNGWMKNFKDY